MASEPKPTLHEIAAMPFPASEQAMRKHYNPDWHKPLPEGVTAKRSFQVKGRFELTHQDSFDVTVEAWTEEEAEDLAHDEVAKEHDEYGDGDLSLYAVNVKEIEQ